MLGPRCLPAAGGVGVWDVGGYEGEKGGLRTLLKHQDGQCGQCGPCRHLADPTSIGNLTTMHETRQKPLQIL